jgi:hypothetical protein
MAIAIVAHFFKITGVLLYILHLKSPNSKVSKSNKANDVHQKGELALQTPKAELVAAVRGMTTDTSTAINSSNS